MEDPSALREENADLRRRIAAVEIERDECAQQNAELFVLQQVFTTMNSTMEIDDILATVLRGVAVALRFGRVVLFDIAAGTATRRIETDSDGNAVPSADPTAHRGTPAFAAMIAGTSELMLGEAADGDSPLADCRGTFCMLPLISRNTVRGILYVDDSPTPEIGENQLRILLDFAAQAAIAIENARLYNETKRLLEETQRLALTDPLTGLSNRRALAELLEREITNAERYGGSLAFMMLDLDDLKSINDTFGHSAGDEALKTFATIIKETARKGDIAARFAGDEFVLVLSQTTRAGAEIAAQRMFERLTAQQLRCSVGISLFPTHGSTQAALFSGADAALYESKVAGKHTYRFAHPPAGGNPASNV